MKKIILSLIAIAFTISFSHAQIAQWDTIGNNIYNTNSGNVGIGINNPAARLDIYNNTRSGGPTLLNLYSNGLSFITMANGNISGAIGISGSVRSGGLSFALGYIGRNGFAPVLNWTSAGTVGIGTGGNNPLATLEVDGTILNGGQQANLDSAIVGNISFIENSGRMLTGWNRSTTEGETDFIANQGSGSSGGFSFYSHNNSGTETQLIRIKGDGTVAIGTTDPKGYKLAVAGRAIAESMTVKLQANWPDVVFKKDYTLMPLSDVKTYIDKNQHLPEIPAAAEVEKDGVNLGEMNRLLVKKVEELTLYLIEKDKKDKEKETQFDLQQKQLTSQQDEINKLKQQLNLITQTLNKN